MPRIDRRFLDCSVYLYETPKAAETGANWGGSGFLLAVPFDQDIDGERRSHIYVVTNSHVVRENKSTVVRLNTHDGRSEVIPTKYDHWIDDWNEDDLAMCMLDDTIMRRFRWLAPEPVDIIDHDLLGGIIDVGTDVIAISRFIDFDGKQQNLPVALFGHISGINGEPVKHGLPRRPVQESFLVDCKAIPGTSGSPVFMGHLAHTGLGNMLLGIVWGYSLRKEPMRRKGESKPMNTMYVHENTGLMLVIPAWKLTKFLNRSDLVNERKRIEREAIDKAENWTSGAAPAAASPDEDELSHKVFIEEDFEETLRKVSRPNKPKEDKPKKAK